MNIAFDNQTFCLQSYGGISRYIVRLAEYLNQLYHAKIFAGLHQNHYIQDLSASMVWGKKIPYPKRGVSYINKFNGILTHRQIDIWQPDIVHKTYYFDDYSYHCPVVITVHDMIHELYQSQFSSQDKTSFLKQKSVEQADHIIAISHSTKKDLMELFGVDGKKITVIYHGFDCFVSQESSKTFYGRPYLLYVGHRGGYKNFANLVRAFVKGDFVKEFDLVAFGGGKWTTQELQLFSELGLNQNHIHQIGGEDSILANLYQNAIAFIYPSQYEGFGIPPLEAMAQGCPVISSNTSSMPEVIGNAGYYFDPNNLDDMIASIQTVLYDEQLKTQLINFGYERLKQFSWQKCAEETYRVYEQMM